MVRRLVGGYPLASFGALVVLFSLAIAAANLGRESTPYALVFVPAIAALIVAGLTDGFRGIVRLFARIGRWRVHPKWYAAAIGIPLLMWLGIDIVGVFLGTPVGNLFQNLDQLPVVMLVVLIPAFIEEFGWRGFAVPAAPRSWPLLVTALVVGVLFLVPHVVLYLPGNLYDNLPLWPLFLIILSGSVLYTWAFAGSGGSALIAALMHAASNGFTPLSRGIDPLVVWQIQGIVITIIAVAIVIVSRRIRRPIGHLDSDSPSESTPTEVAQQTAPA